MAIKKSELYSMLWEACDQLRGGMDASQYKDYVLTLLFIRYVSDKYGNVNDPYSPVVVPEGGGFRDLVAIKNDRNIGENVDKVIAKLAEANNLGDVITKVSFNDPDKMGSGQEMVDKITELIAIFENTNLNFANNRADGDDLIGDAYEYLMRKFATEGGKSKGQFYTPAEVSRILSKLIGIGNETNPQASVYDPACGSGSLLIRALNEAPMDLAGYGQESDTATAGLAKMNAILHNKVTAEIKAGNTFSNPLYRENDNEEQLRTFDYVVANPPFSDKKWTKGWKNFGRLDGYAEPPKKNGDFTWLLHIIKSLKPNGKAAVILPHGVLFRGNAEGEIRKKIITDGWIKCIVSLPPNLFYGTGIPACIIVLDGENREARDGIFMIDASHDFAKDGDKNRLRERDIYKITTTFANRIVSDPKYARLVPMSEIIDENGNNYNLNISRYIDSSVAEDKQSIEAHLHGGIPVEDVDSLQKYWQVFSNLRQALFAEDRTGFYKLNVDKESVLQTINDSSECKALGRIVQEAFDSWRTSIDADLRGINTNSRAKQFISNLAENILAQFANVALLDKYDVYQVLLAYWNEVMADDFYLIGDNGYLVGRELDIVHKKDKKGNEKEEIARWDGKLLPKMLLVKRYFEVEQKKIDELAAKVETLDGEIQEALDNAEEESVLVQVKGDDGKFSKGRLDDAIDDIRSNITTPETAMLELILCNMPSTAEEAKELIKVQPLAKKATTKGVFTEKSIRTRLRKIRSELPILESDKEDYDLLMSLMKKYEDMTEAAKEQKTKEKELEEKLKQKYTQLTEQEIKDILVDDKWYPVIHDGIMEVLAQSMYGMKNRIVELVERYEDTLIDLEQAVAGDELKVKEHLQRMGFVW